MNFLLADIGEGITECEVLKWHCAVGDEISQFDKICEVQSDKANVEITSRYDGVITSLNYKVGQLARVGQPLCVIRLAGTTTAVAAADSQAVTSRPATEPHVDMDVSPSHVTQRTPTHNALPASSSIPQESAHNNVSSTTAASRVLTSPAVRRIAREAHLDLQSVRGTGPNGRVTRDDVMHRINGTAATATTPSSHSHSQHQSGAMQIPIAASPVLVASQSPIIVQPLAAVAATGVDQAHPITGLARIMVQTMTATCQIPLFGYSDEVRCDALHTLRSQLKPLLETGVTPAVKLSYLPLLIKACSQALIEFPQLNAHVNTDCSVLTHRAAHNIGIAIDTPRGLIVPNVKNVQLLSIAQIATELQRLSQLASQGKLTRSDLSGGTFTLSNIGSIGGRIMSPIVVVPEVVICALGAMHIEPRYNAELTALEPHRLMTLSYSADHRVVDGATLARFSNRFKALIEQPQHMLLNMR